jgi:hypothetical protein
MMSGSLMSARFMVLGGFLVVSRRVFVMLCCFVMVFRCLLGHGFSPMDRLDSGTAGRQRKIGEADQFEDSPAPKFKHSAKHRRS